MGEWANGLCGCMGNVTLCLITYIAPCYTAGKNAEAVGDSCIMVGALWYFFPLAGIYLSAVVRGKIREQHQIEVFRSKLLMGS
ncbi:Protein PLANT CADMIUM RESISTANCE 3 [Mizuhopecten yessoensis]|uniref:Protein PLANT CADMIUM RESISTANCE 3 n=1 Tax=Mizuhopecten yessoensis TaxID=6573 RepID=A0A210PJ94_MIZYE|nr:Protein PLANT CADMIUM RESISTANCE 3 [Mizuhopecten yessoensis]